MGQFIIGKNQQAVQGIPIGRLKKAEDDLNNINSGSYTTNGIFTWSTNVSGTLTERMRINTAGNLGIGTASPTARLHVESSDSTTAFKVKGSGSFPWLMQYLKPDGTNLLYNQWDGGNFHHYMGGNLYYNLNGKGWALDGNGNSDSTFSIGGSASIYLNSATTAAPNNANIWAGPTAYATAINTLTSISPFAFSTWAWNGTNGSSINSHSSMKMTQQSTTAGDARLSFADNSNNEISTLNIFTRNWGFNNSTPLARIDAVLSGTSKYLLGAGITNTPTSYTAVLKNDSSGGINGTVSQLALVNTRTPTVGNATALTFLGAGRTTADIISYWTVGSVITAVDSVYNNQTADLVFMAKAAGYYPSADAERMRLTAAGYWGLGAIPTNPWHVSISGAGTWVITTGGALTGSTNMQFNINNTVYEANNVVTLANTATFNFSSTTSALGTPDVGFSRTAAGVVSVGNGTNGSIAGSLVATTFGVGNASDTTISRVSAGTIAVEGAKVCTRQIVTTTGNEPTYNADTCNVLIVTAVTAAINFQTNYTEGTRTSHDTMWYTITANGAYAITWPTSSENSSLTRPTLTINGTLDVGFRWNSTSAKWRYIGYC